MQIEYRVRPVTRYVITRYHQTETASGVDQKGEYDNENVAYEVAYALAAAERQAVGWPVGDGRMIFPPCPGAAAATVVA